MTGKDKYLDKIESKLTGLDMTAEQALKALESVMTIKGNEMLLEGYMYQGTEFKASDIRFEYMALKLAHDLIEREIVREKLDEVWDKERITEYEANAKQALKKKAEGEDNDVQKHIDQLKMILEEATEDENAVCYVTDADAPALRAAISALEEKITLEKKAEIEHDRG